MNPSSVQDYTTLGEPVLSAWERLAIDGVAALLACGVILIAARTLGWLFSRSPRLSSARCARCHAGLAPPGVVIPTQCPECGVELTNRGGTYDSVRWESNRAIVLRVVGRLVLWSIALSLGGGMQLVAQWKLAERLEARLESEMASTDAVDLTRQFRDARSFREILPALTQLQTTTTFRSVLARSGSSVSAEGPSPSLTLDLADELMAWRFESQRVRASIVQLLGVSTGEHEPTDAERDRGRAILRAFGDAIIAVPEELVAGEEHPLTLCDTENFQFLEFSFERIPILIVDGGERDGERLESAAFDSRSVYLLSSSDALRNRLSLAVSSRVPLGHYRLLFEVEAQLFGSREAIALTERSVRVIAPSDRSPTPAADQTQVSIGFTRLEIIRFAGQCTGIVSWETALLERHVERQGHWFLERDGIRLPLNPAAFGSRTPPPALKVCSGTAFEAKVRLPPSFTRSPHAGSETPISIRFEPSPSSTGEGSVVGAVRAVDVVSERSFALVQTMAHEWRFPNHLLYEERAPGLYRSLVPLPDAWLESND